MVAGNEGRLLGPGVFPMSHVQDHEDRKWLGECFICLQLLYEAQPDCLPEDELKIAVPENPSCLKHTENLHLSCFERWIRSQQSAIYEVNISGGIPPSI